MSHQASTCTHSHTHCAEHMQMHTKQNKTLEGECQQQLVGEDQVHPVMCRIMSQVREGQAQCDSIAEAEILRCVQ